MGSVLKSYTADPLPSGDDGISDQLIYLLISAVAAAMLTACGAVAYLERQKALVSRIFDIAHEKGAALLEPERPWVNIEGVRSIRSPPNSPLGGMVESLPNSPSAMNPLICASPSIGKESDGDERSRPVSARQGGGGGAGRPVRAERVFVSPGKQTESPAFLANNKRIRVAELAYDVG
jgi:hypothetical protein